MCITSSLTIKSLTWPVKMLQQHCVLGARVLLVLALLFGSAVNQTINRPPFFMPGTGDMTRFSLPENTPVGSSVYQLKGNNSTINLNTILHNNFNILGVDPEGAQLVYSISGPVFSVDRATGVVKLRQELDRETMKMVEVIISLTGMLFHCER